MKIENYKLKIIFFGTPDFAVPALKSLISFGYQVVAVVTQPEKPIGRARAILPSPVKKVALDNKIKVFEPHSFKKDEGFFKHFKLLNPDLCVIVAYGKIITSQYIEVPRYGFINIHPSLLPKYRGPSPIQTVILSGEKETGVTIMKVDQEVDHGEIISQKTYNFQHATYYLQAEQELAKLGAELLTDTVPKYISGEIKPKEQDHSQATFTKMFTREDGKIDWNKPAEEIYNRIRALNPEPGTWTTWNNKILNIKKAEPVTCQTTKFEPGAIIKIDKKIAVKTAKGCLALEIIQLESGKEMTTQSFLNGHLDFTSLK